MTAQQFNNLDRNAQRACLLTEATFLEERQSVRHDVMLYELDGFYAEVFFLKNTNKLAFIKTITDTEKLAPYLSQINVSDLLQQIPH